MKRWMLAGLSAVAAAACAPSQVSSPEAGRAASSPPAERRCFNAALVNGFKAVDERTVDLNIGARRIFRVELVGVCPEVRDAVGVAVRNRGGSSYVCEDNDVELVVPSQTGPRVCPATGLRERSAAELAAERAARR